MKPKNPLVAQAKIEAKALIDNAKAQAAALLAAAKAKAAAEAQTATEAKAKANAADAALVTLLEQAGQNFRPIPGFPGYEAGDGGTIRNTLTGRSVPASTAGTTNKLRVVLNVGPNRSFQYVHRLVLFAHVGNPPTPEHTAAHKDNDTFNNALTNLRWRAPKPKGKQPIRYAPDNG